MDNLLFDHKPLEKRHKKIRKDISGFNRSRNHESIVQEIKQRESKIASYLENIGDMVAVENADLLKVNVLYELSRCENLIIQLDSQSVENQNTNFQRFYVFHFSEIIIIKVMTICLHLRASLKRYRTVGFDVSIRERLFIEFSGYNLFNIRNTLARVKKCLKKYRL